MEWIWNEALTCKQQTKHHKCLVTPQWPLGGSMMCSQAYSAPSSLIAESLPQCYTVMRYVADKKMRCQSSWNREVKNVLMLLKGT